MDKEDRELRGSREGSLYVDVRNENVHSCIIQLTIKKSEIIKGNWDLF